MSEIATLEISIPVGEYVWQRLVELHHLALMERREFIAFSLPPKYVLAFKAHLHETQRIPFSTRGEITFMGVPVYCVPGQPIHLIYGVEEAARFAYEEDQKEPEAR